MKKCLDMDRIHFIYDDIDSMIFAVSGNKDMDYKQGFSAIVKDYVFYDDNIYKFLSDSYGNLFDQKKLLGLNCEHCGVNMIALSPKCYWLFGDDENTLKLKGMNLNLYPQINKEAYLDNLQNGTVIQGKNISLRQHDGQMSKIQVYKNRLTGTVTKAIVLENECCCPFVWKLTADKFKVKADN
ncbi:MAG: hypothetical protein EZS28_008578 [Streblomastix strix]|uniref:Uncharacterized protein n=1 Tax=Streblomastix strix TaxID=222440 RepID=A0A5J4WLP9_9EUKA|nr:MAG: hypothetical protein EZS28_008578 [Streblomastix strix]